jgi:hypothetical protein
MGFLEKKIAAATAPLATTIDQLQTAVGTTEAGSLATVDERAQLIMGQNYPTLEEGEVWPMSCRSNYFAIQLLKGQLAPVIEFVAATDPTLGLRLRIVEADVSRLESQQAADELALASLRAYAEQTHQLAVATEAGLAAEKLENVAQAARLDALDKQQAADRLDIAALQLAQAATEAKATAALSGVEADRLLAQAADAKANQALADAATAKGLAQAAQAKADTASTSAAEAKGLAQTAQAKGEAAQASATTAINNAAAAQAAATAAGARLRTKRVPTVAMPLSGTVTQVITWDVAFPDANYNALPELEGSGLLNQMASVTARTPTTCTVQIKNTLGLLLAAGAGTLTLTALHD